LLKIFQDKAELENLEVTLLLSIASTGLLIPYARLKEKNHPSSDLHNYYTAASALDKEMHGYFRKSVFTTAVGGHWGFGNVTITDGLYPEDINTLCRPISPKKQTGTVIKIIRNALAHGNILTRGNPIKRILFLSKPFNEAIRYDCIAVTIADFKLFLDKWLDFLSGLNLPNEISEGVDLFPDDVAA
jgi:hypothetical protein